MAKSWKPPSSNDKHHPACSCRPCNGEPEPYRTPTQRAADTARLNGR